MYKIQNLIQIVYGWKIFKPLKATFDKEQKLLNDLPGSKNLKSKHLKIKFKFGKQFYRPRN